MTTDIAINGTIASVLPGDVHTVNETTSSVLPDDLYRVSSHFNDIHNSLFQMTTESVVI
jgi:hypothetical protein